MQPLGDTHRVLKLGNRNSSCAVPRRQYDDGNDDAAKFGARLVLTKVGTPPNALTRICDLTAFKGALPAR
jgi:hypothetical protein